MARKAKINRKTKETNIIVVEANIDGKGSYKIDTKIGFLIICWNNYPNILLLI